MEIQRRWQSRRPDRSVADANSRLCSFRNRGGARCVRWRGAAWPWPGPSHLLSRVAGHVEQSDAILDDGDGQEWDDGPDLFRPLVSDSPDAGVLDCPRNGTPAWDSNTRTPAVNCATPTSVSLGAGKSVTYTLTATGAEALGASGAVGTYYLVDEVTLDGVATRVNAGEVNLAR